MAKIIIPARLNSKRLPGKPLCVINGTTLIMRVFKQCLKTKIDEIYVASDCEEILESFPEQTRILVTEKCDCGTDRVHIAAKKLKVEPDEVIINVQGDMPFIKPELINRFAEFMELNDIGCGTVAIPTKIQEKEDYVSVVCIENYQRKAIYFSRSLLAQNHETFYRHVGLYGYRANILEQFYKAGYSQLEDAERLEQLRIIEHGICDIGVMLSGIDPGSEVNTFSDLEHAQLIAGINE